MKKYGISNYQINNVKQNIANLRLNAKELFAKKTTELRESVADELEVFMEKANESMLSLNRWLKNQEREMMKSEKSEDESSESKEAKTSSDESKSPKASKSATSKATAPKQAKTSILNVVPATAAATEEKATDDLH